MAYQWNDKIFKIGVAGFEELALEIFNFQYHYNPIYKDYTDMLRVKAGEVDRISKIPFLPVGLFKTRTVKTTTFEPHIVFESSGTMQSSNSRHFIKDIGLYKQSFNTTFGLNYGQADEWCIIGLLPSYLERKNSSLVFMVNDLIAQSHHPQSGFYLNEYDKLYKTLLELEGNAQKTLLLGVSFALLDFAEQYPLSLVNTVVLETGGMKGRRQELIRHELHEFLKQAFKVSRIHSEYGMTELLSQAYSEQNGIFHCPPWMKVMIRDEEDPLTVKREAKEPVTGAINIIDLANIYSCAFIATDDSGKLYDNGTFEVIGRIDNSDIRGCSLMML
jgi:hypothetical protein